MSIKAIGLALAAEREARMNYVAEVFLRCRLFGADIKPWLYTLDGVEVESDAYLTRTIRKYMYKNHLIYQARKPPPTFPRDNVIPWRPR
jgi:hypothetical protein